MEKTKLGIGIPTYNRVKYIEKVILQFQEQILEANENINIYISDNSDNNLTSDLIFEMQTKFDNIYYYKNEENIGFDKNVLKVVEFATSEYVWIFGDDDEIQQNTVCTILNYINKFPEVDFFLVNSLSCEPLNLKPIDYNLTGIESDIYFDDSLKALEQISWYSTFIGAYIVKKTIWEKYNATKYINTLFVHVGKIFELAAINNSKIYFISKPLIKYRTNNTTWGSRFLEVQLLLWPKTILMLPDYYPESTKLKAIKSVSNRFVTLGTLASLKISSNLNLLQLKGIIFPFVNSKIEIYRYKILVLSILVYIMPVPILKIIKVLKNLISKKLHDK